MDKIEVEGKFEVKAGHLKMSMECRTEMICNLQLGGTTVMMMIIAAVGFEEFFWDFNG